jgi:hypothetical protein
MAPRVRKPVRKTRAGWYRRETLTYADILDREAQRLDENIDEFMDGIERVSHQRNDLQMLCGQHASATARLLAAKKALID